MGEMRDVFLPSCRAISQLTLGHREAEAVSKSGFKISKGLYVYVSCKVENNSKMEQHEYDFRVVKMLMVWCILSYISLWRAQREKFGEVFWTLRVFRSALKCT